MTGPPGRYKIFLLWPHPGRKVSRKGNPLPRVYVSRSYKAVQGSKDVWETIRFDDGSFIQRRLNPEGIQVDVGEIFVALD